MTQAIGAVPEGVKTRVLNESMQEWSETPFFLAGGDAAKMENALPLDVGQKLAGKLVMIRQTKDGKNHYACLEGFDGQKFRIRAGKIIREALETLPKGTGVVLTYNGVKTSASTQNEYKDFTVEVIEGALN